ncbi:hypothetical protein BC832DRAFT_112391 [Gaertneriomyces semiglobifer]|nr:hypothetical protein BC832DRAFT_112391 [Gaertneriomyces semiglobifer]
MSLERLPSQAPEVENSKDAPTIQNMDSGESQSELLMPKDDYGGFNEVTVNDDEDVAREARIAGRRARIEQKMKANRNTGGPAQKNPDESALLRTKKAEPQPVKMSKSKSQVSTSKRHIESTKQKSLDEATGVHISMIHRESQRRQDEAKKVEVWEKKCTEERQRTEKINQGIQETWATAMDSGNDGPYELHETQKQACDNLLRVKNNLIEEYIAELKVKEDEYVKELKRQSDEIDSLLQNMESYHRAFQKTLQSELEQVEQAFAEERSDVIDANVKEVEVLMEQRRRNEEKFMSERSDRIERHVDELEALRVRDAEEYNLVKIKLETDVQVLEQQLQQMRATYQLNTEKLEYNFQVLKKRDEENGTILGTQKRKITRLTDHLNSLKSKISKQEKTFQQEYMGLTDDYKRITEQFKELQKKFRHFQLSDRQKFADVWKMNDEEAKELVGKLLQADHIISEQQVGLKWQPPEQEAEVFSIVDPMTFHSSRAADVEAASVLSGLKRPRSSRPKGSANTNDANRENITGDTKVSKSPSLAEELLLASELTGSASNAGRFPTTSSFQPTSPMTKKVLHLLCNEASFLVEEKLQKLLEKLDPKEQTLMKLDSIFKAMVVESLDDVEKLMTYFTKEDDGKNRLVEPHEVVGVIRRFIEDRKGRHPAAEEQAPIELPESEPEILNSDADDAECEESNASNANARSQNLRAYWQRMTQIINDDRYRVWTAVHQALIGYNAELVSRYNLVHEVESIARQNQELKLLLGEYMGAKVNDELVISPRTVMMAGAEGR